MNIYAQAAWGALVSGSLYGIVGVGFVMLYRSSKVLSFTQGGFMLLGAYFFYALVTESGLPLLPAILISGAVVAIVSVIVYVVVFARVAAREPFATSVATLGLAGVITAIVSLRYGTTPVSIPDSVVGSVVIRAGGLVITGADLVALGIVILSAGVLIFIVTKTPLGLRMNAVADNASLSVHLGVSAARVATIAWGLAGLTAGLAGVAFALRSSVDPTGIAILGFYAFPAIILGGLDSVPGALAGGLMIGVLQSTTSLLLGPNWVDLISFGVMLVFLLLRPTGLFGRAEAVRL